MQSVDSYYLLGKNLYLIISIHSVCPLYFKNSIKKFIYHMHCFNQAKDQRISKTCATAVTLWYIDIVRLASRWLGV